MEMKFSNQDDSSTDREPQNEMHDRMIEQNSLGIFDKSKWRK